MIGALFSDIRLVSTDLRLFLWLRKMDAEVSKREADTRSDCRGKVLLSLSSAFF